MASRWFEFAPRKAAALRAALIALSVLLLLPACGVFASQLRDAPASAESVQQGHAAAHARHHGDALSGDYCASVGTSASAVTAGRPLGAQPGALVAPAPLAPSYVVTAAIVPHPAVASYPPPVQASFYLRSARILR